MTKHIVLVDPPAPVDDPAEEGIVIGEVDKANN